MAAGDNPLYNYKPRSGELGSPTWFQSDSYTVKNLMYPDDLMSSTNNQYGGNYVIFYINVHEDSYLFKGSEAAKNRVANDQIPPGLRGEASGRFTSGEVIGAAGIAGAFGGANVARGAIGISGKDVVQKIVGIDIDTIKNPIKKGAAQVGANFTTGALVTGAAITALGGVANKYKRMESAIALHVPTDLGIRYSANWSETDMAGMIAAATVSESISNAASELVKGNISQSATDIGNAGGAGINYFVGRGLQTQASASLLVKYLALQLTQRKNNCSVMSTLELSHLVISFSLDPEKKLRKFKPSSRRLSYTCILNSKMLVTSYTLTHPSLISITIRMGKRI